MDCNSYFRGVSYCRNTFTVKKAYGNDLFILFDGHFPPTKKRVYTSSEESYSSLPFSSMRTPRLIINKGTPSNKVQRLKWVKVNTYLNSSWFRAEVDGKVYLTESTKKHYGYLYFVPEGRELEHITGHHSLFHLRKIAEKDLIRRETKELANVVAQLPARQLRIFLQELGKLAEGENEIVTEKLWQVFKSPELEKNAFLDFISITYPKM